ncbi:MAG: hypothetical protein KAS12_06425 [Candidatus Aenigmarchaeota archaeon]|nr:hypothetical protein [Candidatus Aenigmarchaeota archaeon]
MSQNSINNIVTNVITTVPENWKYERLAKDTISGIDLRFREFNQIQSLIGFDFDETIKIIYRETGGFEKYFSITEKKIVAITNKRIFGIEKSMIKSILLEDIQSCKQIKKNIFRWDQLIITKKDDTNLQYGIRWSESAKLFVDFIYTKLQ